MPKFSLVLIIFIGLFLNSVSLESTVAATTANTIKSTAKATGFLAKSSSGDQMKGPFGKDPRQMAKEYDMAHPHHFKRVQQEVEMDELKSQVDLIENEDKMIEHGDLDLLEPPNSKADAERAMDPMIDMVNTESETTNASEENNSDDQENDNYSTDNRSNDHNDSENNYSEEKHNEDNLDNVPENLPPYHTNNDMNDDFSNNY